MVESKNDDSATPNEVTAEEGIEPASDSAPQRLGEIEKCPACGSSVDSQAYHCPTCCNSFCYHCRARVLPHDDQFQCLNQSCDYYGKLLCEICEESVEKEEPPAVYMEPQEGYWPLLLIAVLIAAGLVWRWSSFGWASLFILIGFPVIGILMQLSGLNIFGSQRRVEHRRKSRYRQCLCCGERVKELPGPGFGLGTKPLSDASASRR